MKKVLIIVMLVMLFSLFGCKNSDLVITTTDNQMTTSTLEDISTNPYGDQRARVYLYEKKIKYYLYGEDLDLDNYEVVVTVNREEKERFPLSSGRVSYELTKNKNQFAIEFELYGESVYGLIHSKFGSNPYEWYDSNFDYLIVDDSKSRDLIVLLTNEESLLNKEYSDSDFDFIDFDSFREITLPRHTEIALETKDLSYKRLLVFRINDNSLSNIDSYIEEGKNIPWIEEIYYFPYSLATW
ncbi:hypothetical protein J6Y73_03000 [bacterium]|nr:hypothetical protein [bacterium]